MFAHIIDAIGQKFSWLQKTERFAGLFNKTIYQFPIDTLSTSEINDGMWLLHEIGLHPKIKKGDNSAFITLSAKEYQQLQTALNARYEPFTLFKQDVPYPTDLINEYSYYNDVSEEAWQFLSKHMQVKTDNNSCENTPDNLRRKKENVLKCIDIIRSNMGDIVSDNRIINELVNLYQSFKEDKQYLPDLVIDLTSQAQEKLKRNRLNGSASRVGNDIGLRTDEHIEPYIVLQIFMHEFRHITQKYHQLDLSANEDKIVSSCQDYIRTLAMEAEAKAYSLLDLRKDNAFIDDIIQNHIRNIETELKQKKIHLPDGEYKTPAQKLTGINRFVQAEAEKRTVQTLCNAYLARSRYAAYTVLKADKISLRPTRFNEMMTSIDEWKNFYFNSQKSLLIPDSKFNNKNHEHESIIIEQRWKDQSKITLNLAPQSLFSEQAAANLEIYESIYADAPIPLHPIESHIYYSGVTTQLVHQAEECWKNDNFDKINRIYQQIQKKNPFLPEIKSLYHYSELPAITSGRILKSIQCMNANKKISDVFQSLGYHIDDRFDGITLLPDNTPQTDKDLNRLNNQTFHDVKSVFAPQNQDACANETQSAQVSSVRRSNPLRDIVR